MKTNNPVIQQSMYRINDEADATDGASQQTAPAMTTSRRIRREARPPRWNDPGPVVPTTPISSNGIDQKDDGVTKVRLQGVGIKTNYSMTEVLTITGDAFSKPFTAFFEYMGNTGSLLVDGGPATQEQKEQIRKFTEAFDSVAGAAGAGNIQSAGKILHHIRDAAIGKMPSHDEMAANLMDGVSMVDVDIPNLKAKMSSRSGSLPPSTTGASTAQSAENAGTAATTRKELTKQGPLSLKLAANQEEDQKKIDQFSSPITFYRKDSVIPNPVAASAIHATSYQERRDVLTVGKGSELTSYDPGMRVNLNRNRSASISPTLAGANVITLRSGDDGVAAINLSFADLAPGSTTVVTSGAMRGDMMLFTADDTGFSAYHAQASKKTQAKSADAAATSIADAHQRFGRTDEYPATPQNGFEAMFRAAKSHPFSAVVYSCDDPPEGQPHPKFGPAMDAGLGPNGKLWSMVNFNYLSPDKSFNEVGAAKAIIVKDPNGKVTVQVLAERGKLEKPRNNPRPAYTYRSIESAVGSYTVRDTV